MNNLFTPHQDAVLARISQLQQFANNLIQQRKQVRRDKYLRYEYKVTIDHVLGAIQRLSNQIEKEKPTDSNQ